MKTERRNKAVRVYEAGMTEAVTETLIRLSHENAVLERKAF